MVYKAIFLDLGKVVLDFDFRLGYRALETLCPHSAAEIPKRIAPTGLVERFESGLIGPREFVNRLSAALQLQVDYDRFCAIWNVIFTAPLLPESMLEALARRYRLLLLSNTNAIHFEMIRREYPMLRHFHHLVLSYEVHAMKPKPEIYRAALDLAGCRPQECFYTDDIAAYVDAGRSLGIDAVQFHGRNQLERDLEARGIVFN